jgi:membrane protease subunit HflC
MRAERQRIAKELRAQGQEVAKGIQAVAERERTVILAEASRDAEKTRGEGDARATEIYASAFGKNQEFFEFYRSMNAYRESLSSQQDVLILEPDSEFFKYFHGNISD